jgi:hypothetical protein
VCRDCWTFVEKPSDESSSDVIYIINDDNFHKKIAIVMFMLVLMFFALPNPDDCTFFNFLVATNEF